ncbi:MAG: hypothetical protein M1469_01300 [Bacteroidetes bacterium]|nr:hypothetical protein [Bacteroidota bacterium]
MAIIIQTVSPEDLIDQGRTKFNSNDTAVANAVTATQTQLDTHNHNSIYYTKPEVDAKVNPSDQGQKKSYIEFGVNASNQTLVAGVVVDTIPLGRAGSVTGLRAAHSSGSKYNVDYGYGIKTFLAGDYLTLSFNNTIPGDEVTPLQWGFILSLVRGGVTQSQVIVVTKESAGPFAVSVELEFS